MSLDHAGLIDTMAESTEQPRPPKKNRPWAVWTAAVVMALLLLAAFFPELISPYDPIATDTSASRLGPSLTHLFGTDTLGRDIFSRVVHGTRISLSFGFIATTIALATAIVLGIATGLAPDWLDNIIMRILEILLALPEILVALVIIAMLGKGQANLVLAITITVISTTVLGRRLQSRFEGRTS